MIIDAMKQAADTLERYAPQHGHPDDMSDAITALNAAIERAEKQEPTHIVQSNGRHSPLLTHMMNSRTTPPAAQPAPVQVSPTDFVDMVMDKEDAIGKPLFWAEWPNREKNSAA
jgi:hypothetical protein